MRQVTLRLDDDLIENVRAEAARRGESVNGFAGATLRAAVDPDASGSEIERLRGRLARAGLLAPAVAVPGRPADAEVAAARARAGQGTPLSDLVVEDRR